MRNDYNPIRKGKKVAKAVPMKQHSKIQKPIIMPPIVIAAPLFVI